LCSLQSHSGQLNGRELHGRHQRVTFDGARVENIFRPHTHTARCACHRPRRGWLPLKSVIRVATNLTAGAKAGPCGPRAPARRPSSNIDGMARSPPPQRCGLVATRVDLADFPKFRDSVEILWANHSAKEGVMRFLIITGLVLLPLHAARGANTCDF